MYEIDEYDELHEINHLPQSSIGAPIPMIACDEGTLYLAYYIENVPHDWDGSSVRIIDSDSSGETVALVRFEGCYAHTFGPPNDETFSGHPLANRGLKPYSVFEVKHSSWIRKAESRNAVHEYHNSELFLKNKHHFIFFFHDSTYECIAKSLELKLIKGSVREVLSNAIQKI